MQKKGKKNLRSLLSPQIATVIAALIIIVAAVAVKGILYPSDKKEDGDKTAVSQDVTEKTKKHKHTKETETETEREIEPEPTTELSDDDKVVYLTFDDGPSSNTTRILDALDASGAKATFFVVHSYDGCEKQIKDIYDRGNKVGLHTYSHLYKIYQSEEAYFDDLKKISDLVYSATGYRSDILRFPGGSSNTVSKKYNIGIMTRLTKAVTEKGYAYFDWDWDSRDVANAKDVASITRYATRAIGNDNHVILLMHDAPLQKNTATAIPDIIKAYRDAGYRFDVLSKNSYTVHHTIGN
ncbi:MAG: polysaccharide deacetylase [Clostridiales bacterium]|nr:polysaccharide deacetylase [Clostridiales bacterium]